MIQMTLVISRTLQLFCGFIILLSEVSSGLLVLVRVVGHLYLYIVGGHLK